MQRGNTDQCLLYHLNDQYDKRCQLYHTETNYTNEIKKWTGRKHF